MAYEIELKVFLKDKDNIIKSLEKKGCIWYVEKKQHDKVFYKKEFANNISTNDIFIRIRYENNNSILTLKQILNDTEVKEFESTVGNPNEIIKMFQLLGFKEYVKINKTRIEGKIKDFSICIDEVENLGSFLEIEKITEREDKRAEINLELQDFLLSLGISLEQICNKRYHTMIYELQKSKLH